jgi:hypothetical protein
MKPITIIEDEFAGLWYHPESRVVHHKIRSFLPRGYFKKILSTGAEYLETHGAQKWLSDDEDSVVISQEDIEWGTTVWAPRAIEAGFRYWAIVTPAGAVAAEQMEGVAGRYRRAGVTVRQFRSVSEALAWLETA